MGDQKALEIIGVGDALGVDTSTAVFRRENWWNLVSKIREVKETQSDTGFWLGGVTSQGRQYDHKGVVLRWYWLTGGRGNDEFITPSVFKSDIGRDV